MSQVKSSDMYSGEGCSKVYEAHPNLDIICVRDVGTEKDVVDPGDKIGIVTRDEVKEVHPLSSQKARDILAELGVSHWKKGTAVRDLFNYIFWMIRMKDSVMRGEPREVVLSREIIERYGSLVGATFREEDFRKMYRDACEIGLRNFLQEAEQYVFGIAEKLR